MIITAKRSVVSLFIFVLLSASIVLRIAYISDSMYSEADSQTSTRLLTVGQTRGMIYDRNMQPLVNREMHTMLVVNPTADAMDTLKTQLTDEDYLKASSLAENGKPFVFQCDFYSGDCDDIKDVIVYDRYCENDSAVHLIGYIDSEGNGVCGIEKAFDSLLKENSGTFSVRYKSDATGKMLRGISFENVNDNYDSRGGIVLTIDSEIQRVCENAMEWNNLEKGAVVVLDAKTSEILALASAPSYDRNNLSSALTDENLPFFNRALGAYSVGSVFKPVVSVAALEKGLGTDTVYDCPGYESVSGVKFNCHNRAGHGGCDMSDAMSVSCNSYFINLGQAVGADAIISVAESLGFGKEITLCDSLVSAGGNLSSAENIDSLPSLANLSFGQGDLLATPLQIAAVYCAFANGGYYREPYVLKNIVDEKGGIVAYYKNEINNKVITDDVCRKINGMLSETVEQGSGKLASPMNSSAAGKTATAETGQTVDGQKIVHTWFAGFYPAENPEYVIVVFREDGDSSAVDCAPVFRDIADAVSGK